MSSIHINAPQATAKKADFRECPDCGKRSLFLSFFTPWYGWSATCLRCGRNWQDGEWMALVFYRHARRDNIRSAIRIWRAMPPVEKNHYGLEGES
jgi:hypothetical protein